MATVPPDCSLLPDTLRLSKNSEKSEKCVREGCTNVATAGPNWDIEFCSRKCHLLHWGQVLEDFNKRMLTNETEKCPTCGVQHGLLPL